METLQIKLNQSSAVNHSNTAIDYLVTPCFDSYGQALQYLRKLSSANKNSLQPEIQTNEQYQKMGLNKLIRPLTFKETIEAILNNYDTFYHSTGQKKSEKDRLELLFHDLSTCTGIAYQKGTENVKIIPLCEQLLTIPANYQKSYLPIDYNKVNAQEIDSWIIIPSKTISRENRINNPLWLAAIEYDAKLLNEFYDLVFNVIDDYTSQNKNYQNNQISANWDDYLMRFGIQTNSETDELRALSLMNIFNNNNATGILSLTNSTKFLHLSK